MIQEFTNSVTLPARPRLRPYLDCYPMEDGRLVVEASGTAQHWIFKGKHALHVLGALIPLLDGRHTIEELAAQSHQQLGHIRAALTALQHAGLLMEEEQPTETSGMDGGTDLFLNQQTFFARFPGQTPGEVQRRLAEAQVALIGLPPLGITILALLVRAGIGRIVTIDHRLVTAADIGSTPLLSRDEIGQLRSEAAQRLIARIAPETVHQGYTQPFESAETLAKALGSCHIAVVSTMTFAPRTRALVNEAALHAGIPHLGAEMRGVEGWVGPTVLPGTSPCYHCFLIREQACSPAPTLARARMSWYNTSGEAQATPGCLDASISLLAGITATEALHLLVGEPPPQLIGNLCRVDLVQLRVSRHRLLRLPACPGCPNTIQVGAGEDA